MNPAGWDELAEQTIAEPGDRDFPSGQVASLLNHDLADLARFLDLAGHVR